MSDREFAERDTLPPSTIPPHEEVTIADALYEYRAERARRLGAPIVSWPLWQACLNDARRPAP